MKRKSLKKDNYENVKPKTRNSAKEKSETGQLSKGKI